MEHARELLPIRDDHVVSTSLALAAATAEATIDEIAFVEHVMLTLQQSEHEGGEHEAERRRTLSSIFKRFDVAESGAVRKEDLAAGLVSLAQRSKVDAVSVAIFELYGIDAAAPTLSGGGLQLGEIDRFLRATLTFADGFVPVGGRKSDGAIAARAEQEARAVLCKLGKDPLQSSAGEGEGASLEQICDWLATRPGGVDGAAGDAGSDVPASPLEASMSDWRDDADAQTAARLAKRLAAVRAQRDAVAVAADVEEYTSKRRVSLLSKITDGTFGEGKHREKAKQLVRRLSTAGHTAPTMSRAEKDAAELTFLRDAHSAGTNDATETTQNYSDDDGSAPLAKTSHPSPGRLHRKKAKKPLRRPSTEQAHSATPRRVSTHTSTSKGELRAAPAAVAAVVESRSAARFAPAATLSASKTPTKSEQSMDASAPPSHVPPSAAAAPARRVAARRAAPPLYSPVTLAANRARAMDLYAVLTVTHADGELPYLSAAVQSAATGDVAAMAYLEEAVLEKHLSTAVAQARRGGAVPPALAVRTGAPRSPVTLGTMTTMLDATYTSAGELLTRAAGLSAKLDTRERAHDGSVGSSAYHTALDKAQGGGRRHNLSRSRLSALLGVASGRTVKDITAAIMSRGAGVFLTEAQFRRAIADNVAAESSRILGGAPVDELFALLSTGGEDGSNAQDSSPVVELEELVCCLSIVAAGSVGALSLFHALFAAYDVAQRKRVSEGDFVDLCTTLLPIATALDAPCAPTFLRDKSPFEQRALIEPMAARVYGDAIARSPERGVTRGDGEMDFLEFVLVLSSGIFRPVFKLEGNDVEVFDYIHTHSAAAATAWAEQRRALPAAPHCINPTPGMLQPAHQAAPFASATHLDDVPAHASSSGTLRGACPPPSITPWTPVQRTASTQRTAVAASPRRLELGAWRDDNREANPAAYSVAAPAHAPTQRRTQIVPGTAVLDAAALWRSHASTAAGVERPPAAAAFDSSYIDAARRRFEHEELLVERDLVVHNSAAAGRLVAGHNALERVASERLRIQLARDALAREVDEVERREIGTPNTLRHAAAAQFRQSAAARTVDLERRDLATLRSAQTAQDITAAEHYAAEDEIARLEAERLALQHGKDALARRQQRAEGAHAHRARLQERVGELTRRKLAAQDELAAARERLAAERALGGAPRNSAGRDELRARALVSGAWEAQHAVAAAASSAADRVRLDDAFISLQRSAREVDALHMEGEALASTVHTLPAPLQRIASTAGRATATELRGQRSANRRRRRDSRSQSPPPAPLGSGPGQKPERRALLVAQRAEEARTAVRVDLPANRRVDWERDARAPSPEISWSVSDLSDDER